MKSLILSLSRKSVLMIFGSIYILTLLLAVFPPFYLAASGQSFRLLGIPFSIAYWLIDFIILLLGLWALYVVEDIRGELDEDVAETDGVRVN